MHKCVSSLKAELNCTSGTSNLGVAFGGSSNVLQTELLAQLRNLSIDDSSNDINGDLSGTGTRVRPKTSPKNELWLDLLRGQQILLQITKIVVQAPPSRKKLYV